METNQTWLLTECGKVWQGWPDGLDCPRSTQGCTISGLNADFLERSVTSVTPARMLSLEYLGTESLLDEWPTVALHNSRGTGKSNVLHKTEIKRNMCLNLQGRGECVRAALGPASGCVVVRDMVCLSPFPAEIS